ncbi:tetrahydrofolate synthase [Segatella salivae]|uniref:tetrahydrofolate synthase n=1 Tax=Segatella salivae TaxID=228604 RepID=UPI0027E406E2|nr:tetrahydrofolate synthase [Segatella salivae]
MRWQRRRCRANIPMEISIIMNVTTTQGRRCRANIPMDVFAILYVVTTYHHRCHAGISMDEFRNINALMVQLGTSCSFDSPGLARNEPTPGQRSQGDSTP